jgi:hypothetical protein
VSTRTVAGIVNLFTILPNPWPGWHNRSCDKGKRIGKTNGILHWHLAYALSGALSTSPGSHARGIHARLAERTGAWAGVALRPLGLDTPHKTGEGRTALGERLGKRRLGKKACGLYGAPVPQGPTASEDTAIAEWQ